METARHFSGRAASPHAEMPCWFGYMCGTVWPEPEPGPEPESEPYPEPDADKSFRVSRCPSGLPHDRDTWR
jgi:hypothetical protein